MTLSDHCESFVEPVPRLVTRTEDLELNLEKIATFTALEKIRKSRVSTISPQSRFRNSSDQSDKVESADVAKLETPVPILTLKLSNIGPG